MEKFTVEEYIVTMFELGFERIDSLLNFITLGELYADEEIGRDILIVGGQPNQVFDTYIEHKNEIYSLREGRTIYTNICPVDGAYKPLISVLKRNEKLKSYLNRIDFKKVVETKIRKLEQAGYSDYTEFLCPKEEAIRQSILNEKLYDQESNDIAKAKGTIKKQK